MEKLDFLIEYLLKENKELKVEKMPTNIEDKKNLWRSLCNIRDAKPSSNKYLQIEKEYLQEELRNKAITKVGDITLLEIDSIVNAANSGGLRLFCSLP